MSLDQVLIRPRLLERYAVDELQAGDVVIELFSRLSIDAAEQATGQGDASSLKKIEAAAARALYELNQEVAPRIQQSSAKIIKWFEPLQSGLEQAITAIGQPRDNEAALQSIAAFLEWLAGTLDKLTAAKVTKAVRDLVAILEDDLQYTTGRFGQFLDTLTEDVIEALTAEYLAGTRTESTKKDFIVGSHIAWLRRYYQTEFPIHLPAIRLGDLADQLILELPKTDWDRLAARLAQLFRDLAIVTRSLSGQFTVEVSAEVDLSRNSRMSRDAIPNPQISWYASWLKEQMAEGEFPISMDPAGWEEVLSTLTLLEEYVFVTDRFKPQNEPFGPQIASQGVSFEVQEVWVWLAAVLEKFMEMIFTSTSFREGSAVANGIDIAMKAVESLYTLINGFGQKGEAWVRSQQALGITGKVWDYLGMPIIESLEGEGSGFNLWDKMGKWLANYKWLTAPASFEGEDIFKTWMELLVRDLPLSVMTLTNARKAEASTLHHRATTGVVGFMRYIGFVLGSLANALPLDPVFGGKRHFGLPENRPGHITRFFLVNIFFCGFGFSLLFTFPGYWIANALSGRDTMGKDGIAMDIFKDVLKSYLDWMAFYLFWWDGAGGGKWGIGPNNAILSFPGYADPADSPYELPFAKKDGKLIECIQGPHGFWSHHSWTNKIYAADFGLDYGEEVLAMRGGTVVDYQDFWPDRRYPFPDFHLPVPVLSIISFRLTFNPPNYIVIRHDDATEGALPNAVHDRGPGGTPTTTYATYAHGRHFGVRHAFAARGITPDKIIGTVVKKGEPIMLAGDTGGDAEAVQVHVQITGSVAPDAPTLPFIFKNLPAKGFLRKAPAGVPKTGEYYTSNNEKQLVPPDHGLYQPDRQTGTILRSGVEDDGRRFVVLDPFANLRESTYKNAHIYIAFEDQGQACFLYKKIKEYDNGPRKVYIEGDWDTPIPPPPGSNFEVGAPPRSDKDEFGQQFGYLAKAADNGWTPYKLAEHGTN